nr:MAG: zer-1-like protein [Metapenaeus ensis nimavirus]
MENSPMSLQQCCGKYLVTKIELFCVQEQGTDSWRLAPNVVSLPPTICEFLLWCWQSEYWKIPDNNFLSIFKDTARTKLRVVFLQGILLSNEDLKILLGHKVEQLYLINCWKISQEVLEEILRCKSLRVLEIVEFPYLPYADKFPIRISISQHLEKLVIRNRCVQVESPETNESYLLRHFECGPVDISTILRLSPSIKNLTVLRLQNVGGSQNTISTILEMKSLVDLDISVFYPDHIEIYEDPLEVLQKLVENLKNLVRLNVSGTNLLQPTDENAAFTTRMDNPFDFVGIYGTPLDTNRSRGHLIPAREVAGSASEEEFVTTMETYKSISVTSYLVIKDYKTFLKRNSIVDVRKVFGTIMGTMGIQSMNYEYQLEGIDVLSEISSRGKLTSEDQLLMTQFLLEVMELVLYWWQCRNNAACEKMCKKACRVIRELMGSNTDLAIPYHLLLGFLLPRINHSICREPLLELLHCIVSGSLGEEEKEIVGIQHGAIEILLEGIRLFGDDESWEILGVLTDKAPNNCKKFIESVGEEFIKDQLENKDIITSDSPMTRVLENVTRVEELECDHLETS